jgi:hypothetical protein
VGIDFALDVLTEETQPSVVFLDRRFAVVLQPQRLDLVLTETLAANCAAKAKLASSL